MRKLAAAAQHGKPRLLEPLLLYAHATGQTERLLGYVWKDGLLDEYTAVLALLGNQDLSEVALSAEPPALLPRAYKKLLASFQALYHKPETDSESKRMRWQRSKALQLEKGIATAEIYHQLGLNAGNVNAYMKHGDLSKLSLANTTDIMNYLYAAPSPGDL